MSFFFAQIVQTAPLFLVVLVGFGVMKLFRWPDRVAKTVTKVVFTAVLPILLFHLMSGFSKLPPADPRILVAFFGGCLLVFFLGRLAGPKVLGLDKSGASILGIGGVFSNNVMLGLPLAQMALGKSAIPTVTLVLVFNALILWSLVTVSIEWARHGNLTWKGMVGTLVHVTMNPIIVGILLGLAWGATGWTLPEVIDVPVGWVASAAGPLALLSLGMGLAGYQIGGERKTTAALIILKLVVHPLVVWGLAALLGLPSAETKTLVLLASIALGANVYLMARQFGTLEVPVSQALLISTFVSAASTPLFLALVP